MPTETTMSKHTTVEQLKMLAQRTKTEIDRVDGKVKALTDRVDEMAAIGGEPNVITEIKNNGTALEIKDKAVDIGATITAAVATGVAAADHLTRKKVASVDAIDPDAEGADKFIYLVPKTDAEDNDQYDEYMVLDGAVEHVGSTKVDLSGYLKAEDVVFAEDTEVSDMLDEVFGTSDTPAPDEGEESTEP